ncbi:diguanylate cyclase [Desulfosporosinus sp. HMP52]|uniref:diguanylate cyclase domain-containing protein n=1 Tax=Desulfosporosinus sp. HMP52 TaxID=1487923 RepID=UPI00051F8C0D|nr:diguanylate cyclase [Desulfosporosinus sp. HMP52]KGK85048.1 diguanylate cyclase [Desulfosporosinus sp. HMP52]
MIERDFQRQLFDKELRVLEQALLDIAEGKYEGNEFLTDYKLIVANYEKLLTFTRRIFKISDIQARNLLQRENEIKNILNNAGQGFLTFGQDLIINREYSVECEKIFGFKISRLNILDLLRSADEEQNALFAEVFRTVLESTEQEILQQTISKLPKVIKREDQYLSIELKPIPPSYEDDNLLCMLILTDVTEKHKAQEQVAFLSFHDKLTSLHNRAYIENWLEDLQMEDTFPLSVIMADLNGLKLSNDVFGHIQGDELLIRLAKVLLQCTRKTDIVARWGGDEFLILLPSTDSEACEKVAERIIASCKQQEGLPTELSVSLGMATQKKFTKNISDLFGVAENRMYSDKLLKSKDVRNRLILSVERELHKRFFEDPGHVERVGYLAFNLAKAAELSPGSLDLDNLNLMTRLHDIGKVGIPKEILGKGTELTNQEWEIMQRHSEIGFRMAQSIDELVVAKAILALREHWDGSGYPRGLKGDQIPVLSRLVAIVDAYDVMTHSRPYRPAKSKEEAIQELKQGSGKQFDPSLIDLFISELTKPAKGAI